MKFLDLIILELQDIKKCKYKYYTVRLNMETVICERFQYILLPWSLD